MSKNILPAKNIYGSRVVTVRSGSMTDSSVCNLSSKDASSAVASINRIGFCTPKKIDLKVIHCTNEVKIEIRPALHSST